MDPKGPRKRSADTQISQTSAKKQNIALSRSRVGAHPTPVLSTSTTNGVTSLRERASRLRKERSALPIFQHVAEIQNSLRDQNVLVLMGETGCGKSTQVPQILERESWCKKGTRIAVTQPRRVAAISLATRVAQEMGTVLGMKDKKSSVGYSVRFDKNFSPATRIKYVTEGTLLQEMASDPHLREYSAIVVDEVHERSLNVDVILGHLREIIMGDLAGRNGQPLKVIIMSATLNLRKIANFFAKGSGDNGLPTMETLEQMELSATKEKLDAPGDSHLSVSVQEGRQLEQKDGISKPNTIPTPAEKNTSTSQAPLRAKVRANGNSLKSLVKNLPPTSSARVKSNLDNDRGSAMQNEPSQPSSTSTLTNTEKGTSRLLHERGQDAVATVTVQGRLYPVAVSFTDQEVEKSDRPEYALREIFNINYREQFPGDILVFLPGQDEIESLEAKILQLGEQLSSSAYQLQPLPLFAQLPPEQQARVFLPAPSKTRKVILTTNIAETSLTIPGIRYVVDTGLCKQKRFRPELGLDSLLTTEVSYSSSMQRAGRAGREAPGKCFRIYTEESWKGKVRETEPEIRRCDLARAFLGIVQSLGSIGRALDFPYVDSPKSSAVNQAFFQMLRHSALDPLGSISQDGIHMAHVPLSISLSRVLLTAAKEEYDCLEDAIDMIAGLSVERMFLEVKDEDQKEDIDNVRKDVFVRGSDHLTLMTAVRHYIEEESDRTSWCKQRLISHRSMRNAGQVRKQLRMHFRERKLLSPTLQPAAPTSSPELSSQRKDKIMQCLVHGMIGNVARKQHDAYHTVDTRQSASIHPSSVLSGQSIGFRPDMVVYHELVFTTKNFMRVVSAVEEEWYEGFFRE